MIVIAKTIAVTTRGEDDIINITAQIQDALDNSKVSDGIITVFVSGSTAALTTIEYESGLKIDFPRMLQRIAPKGIEYEHDNTWHDGNGHSHVRASLIGPSITIPFVHKKLTLGTWQQIVLIELDTRSRERKIILQIIGE